MMFSIERVFQWEERWVDFDYYSTSVSVSVHKNTNGRGGGYHGNNI